MRVFFATDGSRAADRARDLLAWLPWPDDTRFCVVSVLDGLGEQFPTPWLVPAAGEIDQAAAEVVRRADDTLADAERSLDRPGRVVETLTLRGRPGSRIVKEARAWGADLVVVGSRGHGPIASMVLGSVSAEVVDHAPSPVLVVRDARIDRIVFADDGSSGAARAARILRAWPVFRSLPVEVVSVTEAALPWAAGMATGMYDEIAAYARDQETARAATRALAERSADRLADVGLQATGQILEGDPASQIVQFADSVPRTLVLVGTRGHGGLARLVLGSVARNVLLHSSGSVLVVRETARPVAEPTMREPVAGGV